MMMYNDLTFILKIKSIILSFLFIAGDECTNDRFENMISNGALDGDPYGISPFQQVINNNNLKENSFFFLGKNIYDTTT
jgi:hypothetical protein